MIEQANRMVKAHSSIRAATTPNEQPDPTQTVSPDDVESSSVAKEAECADGSGPELDVVMPDIYAEKYSPTVPNLKILGGAASSTEESEGFNPYDTAVFIKK